MAEQEEAQDHCRQPASGNGIALEATHAQVGAPGRAGTALTAAPPPAGTAEVEKKEQDGCGQPASGMAPLEAAHAQVGPPGTLTVRTEAPPPAGTIIVAEVEQNRQKVDAPIKTHLPPGLRFIPEDDELLKYYLWPKINKQKVPLELLIHDVDIYRYNPKDLTEKFEPAAEDHGQKHWYFFTPRQRKYLKGTRPRRDAGGGRWKASGKEKQVCNERGETIGVRTALTFYTTGSNGVEINNNWIQQEYRYTDLKDIPRSSSDDKWRLDDAVLAKIYYYPRQSKSKRQDQALNRTPVGTPEKQNSELHGGVAGSLSAKVPANSTLLQRVESELAPFVLLSEKLGRLAVQLVAGGSGVKSVKVTYAFPRTPDGLDPRLLRGMITKGLIESILKADSTLKRRGIRITEEPNFLDGSPESLLEFIQVQIANVESKFASAISEAGEIKVEGRVKDGKPHLTKVGSFEVDVSLKGKLILCRQVDQPGLIGRVGRVLGKQKLNASFMEVGRHAPRSRSVMAIRVDDEPSKKTLKKIGEIPAIEEVVFLKL